MVLRTVFITLFLDLVGFSIIFPLFPSLLRYYLEREGTVGLLGTVISAIRSFESMAGASSDIGLAILFGGFLGSLYSLLQFICAPLLGSLSDRFGRKPVLLISITGIAISYLLWFFAGSFRTLVLARLLGGIMSSNISTATAVVADVTSDTDRPKGMAVIGIAFGTGFILGPAIGGISAGFNFVDHWPALDTWGVNPFSTPALVAFVLSLVNLFFVAVRFPETRPERPTKPRATRPLNPLRLFRTEAYPGVSGTNLAYFLFLTTFSGMEFSLTFLAADRLGYGPKGNAVMMIFIGIVLAAMQGFYVRRHASEIGPQRMSVRGLLFVIPGLFLVGFSTTTGMLYCGLLFMAVGSAQVIPCLTAMASLYTPPHDQGRVLGVFRSLGALARAVGPLMACFLYWRLGPDMAYYVAAVSMVVPAGVVYMLPPPARY
ncbi:MAG: MFS transporter [Candidatus Hydrogenedentes bacterium]|nr:MFS transporter [Candidatus Hydrogenedentota bacterium]